MSKSDPHKETVYRMEHREFRGIWKYSRVPVKKRRRLFATLCKLYGVPVIPIVTRRMERGYGAAYCPVKNRLEFDPKFGKDIIALVHEAAHYFTFHKHGYRAQDHGATFLTYYAKVLSSLRVMPMASFAIIAKRYGLRLTARTSRAYKGRPTPLLTKVS
jgi:hypothetical protein